MHADGEARHRRRLANDRAAAQQSSFAREQMNKVRALILATMATLVAACSSTPTPTPPVVQAPKGTDLSGDWLLTTTSQMGAQDSVMLVKQTGKALAGTMTSQRGSVDYTGSVEGSAVAFSFMLNASGTDLKIDYLGTVQGDTMQGKTLFGSFGEGTFTAKRKGP
jgi:hypothetical protein